MKSKKQTNMQRLTRAEEQIMQVLWDLEKGLVRDVIDKLPSPKPAYNTVSTVIRILEKKGFVGHKAYGTTYEYFPLINKEDYTSVHLSYLMKNYFNNSFPELAAFFARENNLSLEELQDMIKMTEDELKK
jgi:BlaI family transcriptional regulator, penicillinase repressor